MILMGKINLLCSHDTSLPCDLKYLRWSWHFYKKSISPARTDMKVWNLACNLGYVFTKQGKKRNFPSHLKVCFFVYSIFLYQDWIFFHIWQINYEQTFSIVNDHRSPWNFWCFFRDSNGTKMTHSWIGLTIS